MSDPEHCPAATKRRDMSPEDRWALVAEARATFGALAAKQLAEKLGMVSGRSGSLADF